MFGAWTPVRDARTLLLRRAELAEEQARIDRQLAELAVSGRTACYSQRDGERPPGCGRVRYLRVWRRARDAGDEGASKDGRARLLTHEAYARHAAMSLARPRARIVDEPAGLDEQVLAELGAVRRRAS